MGNNCCCINNIKKQKEKKDDMSEKINNILKQYTSTYIFNQLYKPEYKVGFLWLKSQNILHENTDTRELIRLEIPVHDNNKLHGRVYYIITVHKSFIHDIRMWILYKHYMYKNPRHHHQEKKERGGQGEYVLKIHSWYLERYYPNQDSECPDLIKRMIHDLFKNEDR